MEGDWIGNRASLQHHIHNITGIPIDDLLGKPLCPFEIDERLSWAEYRAMERQEDKAYCLLGISDVHMPLIYGEGKEKALLRLREEIDKFQTYASIIEELLIKELTSFTTAV